MPILEHLEPKPVFRFFEELSAIPHGSGNTKAVSDWCVAFAKARGLEVHQDQANNVIIIKEATPGYEAAEPMILQGHLDMVCERAADCTKDMAREGLDLAVEGDTVYAKGTTLGGDDGIAVAIGLALLDDDGLPHPRLEVVFTTEEEVGMEGAAALDVTPLKGRQLLNLDSEEEGVLTVSCAGGCMAACVLPVARKPFSGTALSIAVEGLVGGHSGAEIHKGQGNADTMLGRVLWAMARRTELRLVSADGGLKDNAVPTSAKARVIVTDETAAKAAAAEMASILRMEYQATDPALSIQCEACAEKTNPMDAESTSKVLCMLTCLPNGVQAMSHEIPGLVQTSLNLGVLETEEASIKASFCVRSSVGSQKQMLRERLECLMGQLGGSVTVSGDYPAWEYRRESVLRERMTEVFREQYGRDPKVEAIHAGVECGLLCGKIPGLDCVSIGPDLEEIHTPRERMHIASVQRVWKFVLEVLKRSK